MLINYLLTEVEAEVEVIMRSRSVQNTLRLLKIINFADDAYKDWVRTPEIYRVVLKQFAFAKATYSNIGIHERFRCNDDEEFVGCTDLRIAHG